VWLQDSAFVIDRITALNDSTEDRFFDKLDLDNVGMFGWSFGGAASIQASRDDARVKAAVDMDGTLFGNVAERGTSRPIMLMHSDHGFGVDEKSRETMERMVRIDEEACAALLAKSTSDWYDVTLARSEHGHYSDLVLLLDRNKDAIDPVLAHRIICEYVRAFFDHYLRKAPAPLLAQDPSLFGQVTIRRRTGQK
jgi:predicted dienelactone hydrolase